MKIMKLKGISKNYAANAAHFRRVARNTTQGLDFSEASLRQLHDWESKGVGRVDKSINGFAYGKWLIDLSVSMWIEDIKAGNACKAEFLETAIQRIHNGKKLEHVVASPLFAWVR